MDYFWATFFPVIAGYAAAIIADRKNRGGTNWGAASFILPILVFVVVFLSKVSLEDRDFRGRVGIRKWIGIPMGVLFLLAGVSLALAAVFRERAFLVPWPPSFANVLFSFKGRIPRSIFWLRGAVPIILLFVIAEVGLMVGGTVMLGGNPFPKGSLFSGGFLPSLTFQFLEVGDKIFGKVSASTGPAEVELEMTAAKTTERIAKTVIVGVRTLRVTAARNVSGEYHHIRRQLRLG